MFKPGAGCTGNSRHVEPEDELIFGHQSQFRENIEVREVS